MPSRRSIVATLSLLTAFVLASPMAWADQTETKILIGVRDDAPPFVWTEAATGNHLGFFWDICTKAVERAGYQFSARSVTAVEKKAFLSTSVPHFDLLCDPTTITLARMSNFSDRGKSPQLSFSPIVFVANGTYASPNLGEFDGRGKLPDGKDKLSPACRVRYEKVAPGAKNEPCEDQAWIKMRPTRPAQEKDENGRTKAATPDSYEVWGYVEGSTMDDRFTTELDFAIANLLICPQPYASHQDAARDFCQGKIARYFGDADIIRASIETYARQSGSTCPVPSFSAAGTYEPYAFVTSAQNRTEFPERFSIALYEMFADGTIDRLFAGHFPGVEKSQHLSTLFQINSVPEGEKENDSSVKTATP